jgi:hypothetical protein
MFFNQIKENMGTIDKDDDMTVAIGDTDLQVVVKRGSNVFVIHVSSVSDDSVMLTTMLNDIVISKGRFTSLEEFSYACENSSIKSLVMSVLSKIDDIQDRVDVLDVKLRFNATEYSVLQAKMKSTEEEGELLRARVVVSEMDSIQDSVDVLDMQLRLNAIQRTCLLSKIKSNEEEKKHLEALKKELLSVQNSFEQELRTLAPAEPAPKKMRK